MSYDKDTLFTVLYFWLLFSINKYIDQSRKHIRETVLSAEDTQEYAKQTAKIIWSKFKEFKLSVTKDDEEDEEDEGEEEEEAEDDEDVVDQHENPQEEQEEVIHMYSDEGESQEPSQSILYSSYVWGWKKKLFKMFYFMYLFNSFLINFFFLKKTRNCPDSLSSFTCQTD